MDQVSNSAHGGMLYNTAIRDCAIFEILLNIDDNESTALFAADFADRFNSAYGTWEVICPYSLLAIGGWTR